MKRMVYTILLLAIGSAAMGISAHAATSSRNHRLTPQPISPAEHAAAKQPAHSATKNRFKIVKQILAGKLLSLRPSTAKAGGSSHIPIAPVETSGTNSATDAQLLHPRPVLNWRSLLPGSIQ